MEVYPLHVFDRPNSQVVFSGGCFRQVDLRAKHPILNKVMKRLGIKMVEHSGKDGPLMLYSVVQRVDQLVVLGIHG
jgi:hypothetical protein